MYVPAWIAMVTALQEKSAAANFIQPATTTLTKNSQNCRFLFSK
jgi:hypothetical protein